ncbi:putative raffinose synthase protein Sip1 [Aspergillus clavatus NRRL 1]|uniref:Raffinose synthase protein Sip1, putative n=1 Tax=Aspergillus clavatus (strain ATCC 1007 / CBS 513.65 / DSM 816 / NCTC 3887 / NRRL 1 / QM 1276 / 107) TaxID=344612 RepID=A1CHD6_ASPCL|nr:raffinose synthase protein Sip1, putative [Aspergillus clavatus NRRL 1]EAW10291.1 raffinose synthase protein Sip1, putative [Aspergillus clavatus NRRL 1]
MQISTRNTSTLPITGPGRHQMPSRLEFYRPAQMSLFARVTCYPPLGQVTCLPRIQKALKSEKDDTVRFTVVIESSSLFPEQPWEAHIWHNINNTEWTALPLKKDQPTVAPLVNGSEEDYKYRRYVFSEDIAIPASGGYAQFTVRFRATPEADWQWVNQQRHVNDGELVFTSRESSFDTSGNGPLTPATDAYEAPSISPFAVASVAALATPERDSFSKYFENLSTEVEIESRTSEAPGSFLWSLSGSIEGAKVGESGHKQLALGLPASLARYFALVRVWIPWLGPRHGKKKFRLTEDALLCSFLRTDGSHLVLLAVSGINNVLTLFTSNDNGELVIKATNDHTETSKFQVLASVADDFEVAMSAVIYEARKLVKPYATEEISEESPTPGSPVGDDIVMVENDPKAQWFAEWYDGLTYCTWNGLGQNLTEEKILFALDSMKEHGIKIANLIIDDTWQSLDNEGESQFKRAWTQFEASPKTFPRGIKQATETIRRKHPSIGHIAVWHALFGYWGGISPDGELAQKYKTKEVPLVDPAAKGQIAHAFEKGSVLAIDPDDIQRFYDEFYSFLTSVGIDSVKTDAQFFLDLLKDPEDRKRFTNAYQDAWSISISKHFSARAISCMSMTPQIIFHSQLPTNKAQTPLRNSDDFFPEIPASHTWHIFCNAHNALLTRYLNVLPDWDMFQTYHPFASFHAAARCLSGGPIYITDEPGKHSLDVINQMTASTTQGATVILRPSVVGRSLDMYHDYNEGNILRIGTYTGWAKTGSGMIGLFNIHAAGASCIVPLRDFPGIHPGSEGQYVVRAHTSGIVSDPMRASNEKSLVSIVLEQKGWEILTAYPTKSFPLKGSRGCNAEGTSLTHVAVLGLLGKMTGAAAVVNSDIFVVENGRLRFDVSLKALGTLGIYFSDLQDWSIAKNFMVTILGKPVPRKTVWTEGGEHARVLAIDVLGAWNAMGLNSGWSNEVWVQVFLG